VLFDVEECRDLEMSFKFIGNDTIRDIQVHFILWQNPTLGICLIIYSQNSL